MINRLLILFLVVAGALNAGAQALDALSRATTIAPTDLLMVQTNSAGAAGQKFTRSITASNLLESLLDFSNWPGGAGSGTLTTVKTNAGTVSSTASSLAFIEGTNVTLRATNAAGVVTVQINATGGSGSVDPTNAVLVNIIGTGAITNADNLKLTNNLRNLNRASTLGLPKRIIGLGDSRGALVSHELTETLGTYYGRAGYSFSGGNYFGWFGNVNTTNILRDTNWVMSYRDVGPAGFVVTTNYLSTLGNFGNRLEIYYDKITNGGTFNVQIKTNGGTFYTTSTVATASATLFGAVATVAVIPGYYQVQITNTSAGLVKLLGFGIWDTNSAGIVESYMSDSGLDYANLNSPTTNALAPIFTYLLDRSTLLMESTYDTTYSNALWNFDQNVLRHVANKDVIFLGVPAPDTNTYGAFDYLAANTNIEAVANVLGHQFFNSAPILGSFARQQADGLAGDGIHGTNYAHQHVASGIIERYGLADRYEASALGITGRTNTFTQAQTINGSTASLRIYDKTTPGYFFEALSTAGLGRLRYETPFAAFTILEADSGYGVLSPGTMGDTLGRIGKPWTVISTNFQGVGQSTNANLRVEGTTTLAGILTNGLLYTGAGGIVSTAALSGLTFSGGTLTATAGSALQTNANQFGASTVLTIADRVSLTNLNSYGTGAVFSGHVTVGTNITAQSFIGSGTGAPILKLQTMMSADNAFAITVPTNRFATTTNTFDFTNVLANDVIKMHTSSAGLVVWTNEPASIMTPTAITGVGGANTNFTLLAYQPEVYINGFTNVSIRGVMGYNAARVAYWTCVITNGSGSDRPIEFSAVTNRYRFTGTYGTNAPVTITNNTTLEISGRQVGTNVFVAYGYFAWP